MENGLVDTNVGNSAGGFTAMVLGIVDKVSGIMPEEGPRTIINLVSSPEVSGVSGRYFVNEKLVPSSKISYDLAFCRRLWEISESLTQFK